MTGIVDVTNSPVWDSVASNFAEVAGTFLMVPFTSSAPGTQSPTPHIAAGIRLASAKHQAEIRIALATDKASAGALAEGLFGAESPDLMADMFQELANMWMGDLKAAFNEREIEFTGGLPVSLTREKYDGYLTGSLRSEEYLLSSDGSKVIVRVGVCSKRNTNVKVAALREGMVIAKDVCNDSGILMISAGTRLSERTVDRLHSLLPMDQKIVVAGA